MSSETIVGKLASGIGQGKHFTRLDWARRQFIERLGIDPYPGTVNIVVEQPVALAAWARVVARPGIRIDNPNDGPHDCDARCYRASISGRIPAAIVLPEVDGYPRGQIELIATMNVREALGIADGDPVTLVVG